MVSFKESKKFLDPKVISAISDYKLLARLIIDGFFMGFHKGPRHTVSLDYSKHRDYYPGDPLKLVDWKLFGKTDRYFVKQFEEETNLQAWIVIDISKSMSYSGDKIAMSKREYASYIAAALSYMLLKQRDMVGVILFDGKIRKIINPSSSHQQLGRLLKEFKHLKEGGKSHFNDSAKLVANRIKKRSLIILFSDLLANPEHIEQTLKHFMHKKNELIVFQVLSEEELKFPFEKFGFFEDLETKDRILMQPNYFKEEYVEQMKKYLDQIQQICHKLKVTYKMLETTTSFDQALRVFLQTREKMN